MKKFLCLFLAMIAVLSVSLPVSAASVDSEETEIELNLDEFGNAGVTYGYVVYESETAYFNLANPDESAAFEAIQDNTNANSRSVQPRSIGTFHVGIQKSGSAYRMHYTVTGSGLLSAVGYMKCKSTELLFASTYHDELSILKPPEKLIPIEVSPGVKETDGAPMLITECPYTPQILR